MTLPPRPNFNSGPLCPACGSMGSTVQDSRPNGQTIRRRRACIQCAQRYTTYEIVDRAQGGGAVYVAVQQAVEAIAAIHGSLTELKIKLAKSLID